MLIFTSIVLAVLHGYSCGLELTPIVETGSGSIRGKVEHFGNQRVFQFLGIPYADSPIGKLRFQKPVRPPLWQGIRDTLNYSSPCLQRNEATIIGSEDCLYLNVFVTSQTFYQSSPPRYGNPVIVLIHGDNFDSGSASDISLNSIVALKDLIFVTFNYRLGPFGFINLKDSRIHSNIGLWDQNLALTWVNENIKAFGGNPNTVTLFGHGSGSKSITGHLISIHSSGLFKRAVLSSGSLMVPWNNDRLVRKNSLQFLRKTTCGTRPDLIGCLQGMNAKLLLSKAASGFEPFGPIFGDDFLPNKPIDAFSNRSYSDQVDLIVGVDQDDFSLRMQSFDSKAFSLTSPTELDLTRAERLLSILYKDEALELFNDLYLNSANVSTNLLSHFFRQNLVKAFSDFATVCPTYMFAYQFAKSSKQSGRVYGYLHRQRPSIGLPGLDSLAQNIPHSWIGTPHGSAAPFFLGLPIRFTPGYSNEDLRLSLKMTSYLTLFTRTGSINNKNIFWNTFQNATAHGEIPSSLVFMWPGFGEIDSNRISFCIDNWPTMIKYGKTDLVTSLSEAN